jgi:low temperature requirement protein LtrA
MRAAGEAREHESTRRRQAEALLRGPGGSQRATLLELLFDLVFVAAIALSSMSLASQVSWAGAVRVLLPLLAVWWVWSITTLVTDFYDPQRLRIQVVIVGTMLGSMMLAAGIPQAFGARGLVFASCYVAVHIGRGIFLVASLGGSQAQARAARFMIWFAASGVAWIAGGLASGESRAVLWAVGLTVDYVAAGLRYPVPGLGRVPLAQYGKAGEHVGERYQQFIILALGDLILVPTIRYGQGPPTAARTAAFLSTFATTLLLWQIYVYRAGSLLLTVVNRRPGRVVRWAPYTHATMAAGIVATAAGFDLLVQHPTGSTPTGRVAVSIGGAALFLAGRNTFEYQVYGRIGWTRSAFLVLLVGLAPVLVGLAPLQVTGVIGAVLAGVAVADTLRSRLGRDRRDPSTVDDSQPAGRRSGA